MGRRRERNELASSKTKQQEDDTNARNDSSEQPPTKKPRMAGDEHANSVIVDEQQQDQEQPISQNERPKSKKELRAEKKKARRLAVDPEFAELEKQRMLEARKKEQEREHLKQLIREERNKQKLRQQKRINRERNAPGSTLSDSSKKKSPKHSSKEDALAKTEIAQEEEVARKVINEIKYGRSDTSGWTTLPLGVKYKDIVVGKGPIVQDKSLVTVKYELTGGRFGAVIDSSKKFDFRVGKGEVIQAWDIGVSGMKVGGQRKLVVPPKAGYGSRDIGAGPGGILYFDITVLAVR